MPQIGHFPGAPRAPRGASGRCSARWRRDPPRRSRRARPRVRRELASVAASASASSASATIGRKRLMARSSVGRGFAERARELGVAAGQAGLRLVLAELGGAQGALGVDELEKAAPGRSRTRRARMRRDRWPTGAGARASARAGAAPRAGARPRTSPRKRTRSSSRRRRLLLARELRVRPRRARRAGARAAAAGSSSMPTNGRSGVSCQQPSYAPRSVKSGRYSRRASATAASRARIRAAFAQLRPLREGAPRQLGRVEIVRRAPRRARGGGGGSGSPARDAGAC